VIILTVHKQELKTLWGTKNREVLIAELHGTSRLIPNLFTGGGGTDRGLFKRDFAKKIEESLCISNVIPVLKKYYCLNLFFEKICAEQKKSNDKVVEEFSLPPKGESHEDMYCI
jgi:hypothetical protein